MSHVMTAHLEDVSVRRRGTRLLGPLTLALGQAGIIIVLGPNGAGKTTLLKVLHGVERLSSGSVSWSGTAPEGRQAQAYVFQRPIVLRRSVRQNLAYPLKLAGMGRSEIAERVEHWADRVGLTARLDHPAPRLSGGEKQKLAIGRALIRRPQVLFLDEPCANLDGRSTREIETLLRDAHAAGTQIVMTTHNLGQARRMADEVVFLLAGRVHERGQAAALFAAPQRAETAAFLQGDIVE